MMKKNAIQMSVVDRANRAENNRRTDAVSGGPCRDTGAGSAPTAARFKRRSSAFTLGSASDGRRVIRKSNDSGRPQYTAGSITNDITAPNWNADRQPYRAIST